METGPWSYFSLELLVLNFFFFFLESAPMNTLFGLTGPSKGTSYLVLSLSEALGITPKHLLWCSL